MFLTIKLALLVISFKNKIYRISFRFKNKKCLNKKKMKNITRNLIFSTEERLLEV